MSSWQRIERLADDLPGLLGDRVHLLTLELQRASRACVSLVVWALAAILCGATAWFWLWVAFVHVALQAGWHPWLIGLVVIGGNVLVVLLAVARIRHLAPLLKLPATVRHLTHSALQEGGAPSAATQQEAR